MGSLASGDGDLDRKQEDMEKEKQREIEEENIEKENTKKLKVLLEELKKYHQVICEIRENGFWNVKSELLKEGFVEEVQEQVREIIEVATKIKTERDSKSFIEMSVNDITEFNKNINDEDKKIYEDTREKLLTWGNNTAFYQQFLKIKKVSHQKYIVIIKEKKYSIR